MPISSIRRTASAAVVAAAGVATFLGAPAGAQTCYPPTANCATTTSSPVVTSQLTLQLSATTLNRNQTIQAVAGGFPVGSNGIFSILSAEQQIGTFTVTAAGTGTASITIPSGIELGTHTIFARGTVAGVPASVSRVVTVVADGNGNGGTGSTGNLARTGAVVVPTALVGIGLVAGGVALKRSAKRKTSAAS